MDYKIIKFCRLCKARFVVPRGESKKYYCEKCQEMVSKQRQKQVEEENERKS